MLGQSAAAANSKFNESMATKEAKKKTASVKTTRVKCRALVACEVEILPGRSGQVAKGGLVTCDKATADLLKDKLEIIGAI